jgi:hypothetical protein
MDAPPARCDLTVSQLADLMRAAILVQPIPDRYTYAGPLDILADLHLVARNEVMAARERAESAERQSRGARQAATRAWRLLRDTGKRKTIRTDDLYAALAGDDDREGVA